MGNEIYAYTAHVFKYETAEGDVKPRQVQLKDRDIERLKELVADSGARDFEITAEDEDDHLFVVVKFEYPLRTYNQFIGKMRHEKFHFVCSFEGVVK